MFLPSLARARDGNVVYFGGYCWVNAFGQNMGILKKKALDTEGGIRFNWICVIVRWASIKLFYRRPMVEKLLFFVKFNLRAYRF
ncbi:MAG: hypothetical protein U5L45_17965 [Saprospiraceae bacterium]|nr:hypothetical protein [Saprospiraceae bacterium]